MKPRKKIGQRLIVLPLIILVINLNFPDYSELQGQTADNNSAGRYFNSISDECTAIDKELWKYISSFAHGRSARKIESNRQILLQAIQRTRAKIFNIPAYNGSYSLRDSVLSYLSLNYDVVNRDFGRIIDMEKVAEQSYDDMEAYLITIERVNLKLETASQQLDSIYEAFADEYGLELIERTDRLSLKLKSALETFKYYNRIYLIFFKCHFQETRMLNALELHEFDKVDENRSNLSLFSEEGILKLDSLGAYRGDNILNTVTRRYLLFYKEEAEKKIPILSDFSQIKLEYNEMAALLESKDRMFISNEEIERYNRAADAYNKGLSLYNSTDNMLESKRKYQTNSWNNALETFMKRHVPK